MRLIVAHKILIAAALFLCAVLLLRGARIYAATGDLIELALAVGAGIVGLALCLYLRHIWKK